MKIAVAKTKNLVNLAKAADQLRTRSMGTPGIGLIWGPSGLGKTTAATWFCDRYDAVYVRAWSTWTASSMLSAISAALDLPAATRVSVAIEQIVRRLSETQRPLFVDEADYLLGSNRLLDTLRDIHDVSSAPVIVVGMGEFRRRAERREQFAGRITARVEFRPADVEDARTAAMALLERVRPSDELLARLVQSSGGSMRRIVSGLSQIERLATRRRIAEVSLADWGTRPFDGAIGDFGASAKTGEEVLA